MCQIGQGREASLSIFGSHTSEMPIPNCRGSYYGPGTGHCWEQACIVFHDDYLTKWPIVCPLPDQKASHIAQNLVDEAISLFGVSKALLSDRGTNLLSHFMKDLCELLGINKLNMTAYHSE